MGIVISNTFQAVGLIGTTPTLVVVSNTGPIAEVISKAVLIAGVNSNGEVALIHLNSSGSLLS